MKKIFIFSIIVIFLVMFYTFSKNSFSLPKNNILPNDNYEKAYVNSFTIYGRFFNLEGFIPAKVDNLILVLKNDLCEDEPGEIEKIIDNWSDFKRKLERRLEEMKRSDRRYHEAQRRKRNKHND